MDLGIQGRLALITGSSSGLGKTIAKSLAEEGVDVIINGRNEKSVLDTVKEIRKKYAVNAWPCVVDATDRNSINNFFMAGPITEKGSLDILVNNIGNTNKFGSFMELNDQDWLDCYNLTFMSAVRFTREALPFLTASGCGRIINISSLVAHQPGFNFAHYASAKSALNNLTKYLANILGEKKILVNAICPSNIDATKNIPDMAARKGISLVRAEQEIYEAEINKSPLRIMGTRSDVADFVVFLASEKAKFLTGNIYNVDGGITKGL